MMLESKKGLVGWLVVFSAFFVWLIILVVWYNPSPVLDPSDKSNVLIVLWWTVVCGICVFIGLRIEKTRETS